MRIIVVQGHRNTTAGGADGEAARTPRIANAITAALKGRGHDVHCLQNDDGSADDWYDGSLDAVARRVIWYDRQAPVDLMLDCHLEGDAAGTRGVFAIFPDGDGLQTLTPYDGSDSANTLDRALGTTIAAAIAARTGLSLRTRGCVAPGLMSEKQTGVGADLGWRLAMFGYTVPARAHMVRLVVEFGNAVTDRALIDRPDFAANCGAAVADAIARHQGGGGGEGGKDGKDGPGGGLPPFGTIVPLPAPRLLTVTAAAGLNARKYAELDQPIMATWPAGTQFQAGAWVVGEAVAGNPIWWITADARQWRVWSGGTA